MQRLALFLLAASCFEVSTTALDVAAPWEQYILSPSSRDVLPASIYSTSGDATLDELDPLAVTLTGDEPTVTFDFGRQMNGFLTIDFGPSTTPEALVGVAFTENKAYIGIESDNSTDTGVRDGTIYAVAEPSGSFTFGREFARGSYRYLTLSTSTANATAQITAVTSHFTASPFTDADKLRNYSGYFYSDDDLLNRIWYAGVYTIQLCTIAANESRAIPPTITDYGWFNNVTVSNVEAGGEVLVDGAKRDRTPWAGDFGASLMAKSVSLNADNLRPVRNSILSLFALQDPAGQLPYGGSPMSDLFSTIGLNSNTYHLWALIVLADYTSVSGDVDTFKAMWNQSKLGFDFILAQLDSADWLLEITTSADWGHVGQTGKTIVGNTLLFRALSLHASLANELGLDGATLNGTAFEQVAAEIKSAINSNLWDESAGMYYDNTTAVGHNLHPQDGNALAIRFNVTESPDQAESISAGLVTRWNEFGAVSPEGGNAISPFITGFEVDAHFLASPGDSSRAVELLRRQWGYMLQTFSNSTFIEGYNDAGELSYPFYETGSEAFISHVHAWSTGPVSSMVLFLGGLRSISDADRMWVFQPHAAGSGISSLQTGYTLGSGTFAVDWTTNVDERTFFQAEVVTPAGTTGEIWVPTFGKSSSAIEIFINGEIVWSCGHVESSTVGEVAATASYVVVSGVQSSGGVFSVVARESKN